MKIAIFTNNYLPNPYGVSTSVEGFRLSLIKKGHTVYVFAPEWFERVTKDEKNIFRYPAIKAPTKIDFSLVVPFSSYIDAQIAEMDFDIIHAQHPNLLGITAKRWARKKSIPLVFTWHSLYDRYAHYMPFVPEKISAHIAMKNAASFAKQADCIIAPTDAITSLIKKVGVNSHRINVVESGVDEKLFANPNGKNIRRKHKIADNAIVLVTVSRLTEEKNVLFLAKQVANVLAQNDNIVFLCCGEGDQKCEMKKIFIEEGVLDKVIFTGKIARDVVKNYLAAGDIFVYASTSETQGTIVTENMYIGRPIVGVGINGVGSLIEDEKSGLLTKEDDSFSYNIQRLIDDETLRNRIGKESYVIAREKYTSDKCAEKLFSVYEKTITEFKR
ncbi:MAG: hypothetical protein CR972_04225 [Candidatus Moraniibacteriota bacterium]|nr:MAG: hypothetical protein CR972_04225 [Candidatus Moranbacteria bacterium]